MLVTISIISLLLLIWFRTEAWLEYTRLFGLNFLSFYKDYDVKRNEDLFLTYHGYLRQYHNCFFVRLITCPLCLAIWIALAGVIAYAIFSMILLLALGAPLVVLVSFGATLVGYFMNVPLIVLISVSVFAAIDKLLG